MKNLYNNLVNKEFFKNEFNNSIRTYFKDISNDIGDILYSLEVLAVNLSSATNNKVYNGKYMDLFAREIEDILHENKIVIQNRINVSFSKLLDNLDK